MSVPKLPKILRAVYKMAVTMSLFIFLFFSIRHEYADAKLRKLNNFATGSYDYLIDLMESRVRRNPARIEEYEHYYKMLIAYVHERADAYGMLGFCAYHLEKNQKAIAYYQKAIEINPHFFWFHYSLGVIYFNEGMYEQAGESFVHARAVVPDGTLKFLFTSKVYQPILATLPNPTSLLVNLNDGFQNCYLIQTAIQHQRGSTPTMKNRFYPRIF